MKGVGCRPILRRILPLPFSARDDRDSNESNDMRLDIAYKVLIQTVPSEH
jgi:hypothetical protein